MQPLTRAGITAVGVAALCLSIVVAARTILPGIGAWPRTTRTAEDVFGPATSADPDPVAATVPVETQAVRPVGEDVVAQPELKKGEKLVRDKARGPLSALSQALPPPKPDTKLFYRPVASASAVFDSMGYRLAIAGTDSVGPDETCTRDGVTWACGMQARTAVRLWVRGRAFTCKFPDKDGGVVVVGCWLGKQDVGAWLVSNGWARAAPGGPYVEAEAKARKAGMGIFGAPPAALPQDDVVLPEIVSPSGDAPVDDGLPGESTPATLN